MTEKNKTNNRGNENGRTYKIIEGIANGQERNEEIPNQMNVQDIFTNIEQKQMTWNGHVQRMEDHRLPKHAMNWITG